MEGRAVGAPKRPTLTRTGSDTDRAPCRGGVGGGATAQIAPHRRLTRIRQRARVQPRMPCSSPHRERVQGGPTGQVVADDEAVDPDHFRRAHRVWVADEELHYHVDQKGGVGETVEGKHEVQPWRHTVLACSTDKRRTVFCVRGGEEGRSIVLTTRKHGRNAQAPYLCASALHRFAQGSQRQAADL